jgi:hypothetical protein
MKDFMVTVIGATNTKIGCDDTVYEITKGDELKIPAKIVESLVRVGYVEAKVSSNQTISK